MKNVIICVLLIAVLLSCVGIYSLAKNGDAVVPPQDEVKDPVDNPSDEPPNEPSDEPTDEPGDDNTQEHVCSYGTEWLNDVEYHWHVCSCGAVSDKAVHNFTDWVIAQEATETEKGLKVKVCYTCGLNVREEIPALGETGNSDENSGSVCWEHTWVAATCTVPKTCSVCGVTEGEALGHVSVVLDPVDPTCVEPGLTQGSQCSVCGEILVAQEVVDALEHTEEEIPAVAPTCTEAGLTEGKKCSVCGEILRAQEVQSPLGHAYVDGVCVFCSLSECDVEGHQWSPRTCYEARNCSRCGLIDGEPYAHYYNEATCLLPKVCIRCGLIEGEPLGHAWLEATCTVPKSCSRCGLNEGKPLGHDLIVGDCVSSVTCSRCSYSENGHSYGDWSVTIAATVTKDGSRSKTCSICGDVLSETIPATGTLGLSYTLLSDDTYAVSVGSAGNYESIVIPSFYNGKAVTQIKECGFSGCDSLKSITIPDSVVVIGERAFGDCFYLENVKLPSKLEHIGDRAFWGCHRAFLSGEVEFPDTILSLGKNVFNATKVERFIVPVSLESIDNFSLNPGTGVQISIYYKGTRDEWDAIERRASSCYPSSALIYYECEGSLQYRYLANKARMEVSAGFGIDEVTEIVIEEKYNRVVLAYIAESAFAGCVDLQSVTMSNNIISIGANAFADCPNLTDIYFEGTEEEWDAITKGDNAISSSVTIHFS